mmetsp:Transcript_24522/g.27187  ORF Transcript_24522/g.27187 Transcript_24522/m.27187 type:complete len:130 (-) Transcript_24522:59-448(-)
MYEDANAAPPMAYGPPGGAEAPAAAYGPPDGAQAPPGAYGQPPPGAYDQPPPNAYGQQAQAPVYADAPGSRSHSRGGVGGGIQLPIAQKDYSSFGGHPEGAGIGEGYSQPMQEVAQPANFQGGAGSKFY